MPVTVRCSVISSTLLKRQCRLVGQVDASRKRLDEGTDDSLLLVASLRSKKRTIGPSMSVARLFEHTLGKF